MSIGIVWFRADLRLSDNPALYAASQNCDTIIPVFIDDTHSNTLNPLGAASRAWLHHSLQQLQHTLAQHGSTLILRQGSALETLSAIIKSSGATQVFWNRLYDPISIQRDTQIKQTLSTLVSVQSFNSSLLFEPWQILKADKSPYKVFTAYWKQVLQQGINHPLTPNPLHINPPPVLPHSLTLNDLQLLPSKPRWDQAMMQHWQVGEAAAHQKLEYFLANGVAHYSINRDRPDLISTSKLSPHLHFGELSPRQVIHATTHYKSTHPEWSADLLKFESEVGWREFGYYLLYHFPQTTTEPLDQRFKQFPWRSPSEYAADLKRWQQGTTGFPIIDAGMRQLWQTGWMHNRVRMIVASFLTKNLLIPWQVGEAWFRDTLVDADLASNVLGWQWTAGCGADAAPYFRIFNPVTQGEKFDPDGAYVKTYVSELSIRAPKVLHMPRSLGEGIHYPLPIVDLGASRTRALAAFEHIKATPAHEKA
jgi:deoxyribodipyrimidine photo-lyase